MEATKENELPATTGTDEEVKEALIQIQEENGKKTQVVNKRIDFDKKSLRRIETMLPVYSEDLGEDASASEAFSYVVQKAVDALFEGDFKKKIEEL